MDSKFDANITWAILFCLYLLFVLALGFYLLFEKTSSRKEVYFDSRKNFNQNSELESKWQKAFQIIKNRKTNEKLMRNQQDLIPN